MRKLRILAIPLLLVLAYAAGPNPATPLYSQQLPAVPSSPDSLESYIRLLESAHKLKPDNEARIIWNNDSLRQPTDYVVVYLHGFSASQFEGAPTHEHIARKLGANLYLARLAEHGIDTTAALANLDAEKYWASAKQALAIGKKLGKKLILMGTSTGGSNALQLAAQYPGDVYALILLSPNIAINDPNAWILNNPWGLQIARLVMGGDSRSSSDTRPRYKQYWNSPYRLEGAVALEEYLETTMTPETFVRIHQPLLLLYYYKDEAHQDDVVKVAAMRQMFKTVLTPAALKRERAMPLTGDHVIGSPFKSKDAPGVEREIALFLDEVLKVSDTHHF